MTARSSRTVRIALFCTWFAATAVPLGLLMAGHLAPAAIASAPGPGDRWPGAANAHWRVIHVVARDCPCSHAVVAHLVERGAVASAREDVLITGEGALDVAALTARGFHVDPRPADGQAAMAGITAAPWLVIVAPGGAVAYSGGYRAAASAREWDDERVLAALGRGEPAATRPVFGCAMGRLRQRQDPLGLKWLRRLG